MCEPVSSVSRVQWTPSSLPKIKSDHTSGLLLLGSGKENAAVREQGSLLSTSPPHCFAFSGFGYLSVNYSVKRGMENSRNKQFVYFKLQAIMGTWRNCTLRHSDAAPFCLGCESFLWSAYPCYRCNLPLLTQEPPGDQINDCGISGDPVTLALFYKGPKVQEWYNLEMIQATKNFL